jgi:trigger factor
VKVGDLSAVTIERPLADVGPEDIERTIEMLRRQRTRYEPVSRAARRRRPRDRRLHRQGRGRRVPRRPGERLPIVLGEGRMLPEFESVLVG